MTKALGERVERLGRGREKGRLANTLNEIALHSAALPELDTRTPDAIVGYDESGLPR